MPAGFAEEVERAARQSGAVALRTLRPAQGKLTRRAEGLLFDALARRGLERTARALRVPLRDQLAALLAAGEPIATASLRKQLKGVVNAAELTLVVADQVRAGRAALVMRGGKEHIAAPSAALLSRDEVAQVATLARALSRLAASARPAGAARKAGARSRAPRTLLRAELLALLDPLHRAAAGDDRPDGDPLALVMAAARGQTNPTTGLAFVPEVARALGGRLEGDALRAALVRAARSGMVELRPESGIELLSPSDAAACPRGPDGSPLSWMRVLDPVDRAGPVDRGGP